MNIYTNIIIIDDDPISNHVCNLYIKILKPDMKILSFTNPLEALNCFYNFLNKKTTLLFLDINMPQINGWQMLDKFPRTHIKMDIIILSSSISKTDQDKVQEYPEVIDFIIKPITKEKLQKYLY